MNEQVLERRDKVRGTALQRSRRLEESRQLHLFQRNIHEVMTTF